MGRSTLQPPRSSQPRCSAPSTGAPKGPVALLDELGVRLLVLPGGQPQRQAVRILQTVLEHRSVDLVEDIGSDLDDEVGAHPQDLAVEGSVVDFAEG